METIKKYWAQIIGTIGIVTPLIGWVGQSIIEGAENKGYVKAKQEINEKYNNALRDAVIFRAKWESCCTELHEDNEQ